MTLRSGIRRRKRYHPFFTRDVLLWSGRRDKTPPAVEGRLTGIAGGATPKTSEQRLLPLKSGLPTWASGVLMKTGRSRTVLG